MPRALLLLCLPLMLPLACGDEAVGDDLPAGAFTSGPDDNGNAETTSDTTSGTSDGPGNSESTSGDPELSSSSSGSSGPPLELFHDQDILPIWTASCIDSNCHDDDGPQAGLDLMTDGVYTRLCESFHPFSGMPYVDCEGLDPHNSYLFRKVEGTHLEGISGAAGGPMPPGGSLPDDEITMIESWIAGGAIQ